MTKNPDLKRLVAGPRPWKQNALPEPSGVLADFDHSQGEIQVFRMMSKIILVLGFRWF